MVWWSELNWYFLQAFQWETFLFSVCFARSARFYFPLIIKIISKYFSSLLSVYMFPFLLNAGGGLSYPFHGWCSVHWFNWTCADFPCKLNRAAHMSSLSWSASYPHLPVSILFSCNAMMLNAYFRELSSLGRICKLDGSSLVFFHG